MKVAVVAEINFFDNVILQAPVVVADSATWKDAYIAYLSSKETSDADYTTWIKGLPEDLEEARVELGNGEMDICVTFIEQF